MPIAAATSKVRIGGGGARLRLRRGMNNNKKNPPRCAVNDGARGQLCARRELRKRRDTICTAPTR